MNIIAGIIVIIAFIINLAVLIQTFNSKEDKPFGMVLWLFVQMIIDFVAMLFLFTI